MAWLDDPLVRGVLAAIPTAIGGRFALRWIRDWGSESLALKNIREEMKRLSARIEELEKDVAAKQEDIEALQKKVDQERALRRDAEDMLDTERRSRIELEKRVNGLERKT